MFLITVEVLSGFFIENVHNFKLMCVLFL